MIQTLLLAAVAAAVVELLVPHGDGGRVAAYVRLIGGLFLLVVLLAPLGEGVELLQEAADGELAERLPEALLPEGEPTDYEAILRDTLCTAGAAEVEAWVRERLSADFDIPSENATVAALTETVENAGGTSVAPVLREVRIALHGSSALSDPHPIEEAIGEALGCSCYVTVG